MPCIAHAARRLACTYVESPLGNKNIKNILDPSHSLAHVQLSGLSVDL